MRVLIVDDDAIFAAELEQMLTAAGYTVEVCTDSVAAVGRIQANRPDIVLLDIKMARMNGYQVTYYLRRAEDTANLPIIGVSAFGDDLESIRATELFGMNAFLTKPVSPTELMAHIERLASTGGAL